MNPRLSMLAVLLVPGLGPLCCGHRCTAVATVVLALVPLLCGLPSVYYAASWIAALLLSALLSARASGSQL